MAIINDIDITVSELNLIGNPPSGWYVAFVVTARNGERFVAETDNVALSDASTPEEAIDTARSMLEAGIIEQALTAESRSSSLVGTTFQIEMPEPLEVEDEPEDEPEGESDTE